MPPTIPTRRAPRTTACVRDIRWSPGGWLEGSLERDRDDVCRNRKHARVQLRGRLRPVGSLDDASACTRCRDVRVATVELPLRSEWDFDAERRIPAVLLRKEWR